MVAAYLAAYDRKKKWWQTNRKQQDVLYWAGWLIPVGAFFSVANFFHPYYTIMLAPPLAVLAALAITSGLKRPRRKGMIRGRAGCVTFIHGLRDHRLPSVLLCLGLLSVVKFGYFDFDRGCVGHDDLDPS